MTTARTNKWADQHARLERARADFRGWWTPPLREALHAGFDDVLGVPAVARGA
jgi:hypothetical protein